MRYAILVCLNACANAEQIAMPADDMIHIEPRRSRDIVSAPFSIDRGVVSQRAFHACIEAGACPNLMSEPSSLEHARVQWSHATAYCAWRGTRLPTNLELVRAEASLHVDGELVWTADIDERHPDRRMVQHLSSLPRGWNQDWPPSGLDAHSDSIEELHEFRCVRSAKSSDDGVDPANGSHHAVFIPAGIKMLSSCRSQNGESCRRDSNAQRVGVHAYLLDRLEVTNSEYARCVEAGACEPSSFVFPLEEPNIPALVRWSGAVSYCRWRGARIPDAVEWESAARSGDDREFPWGNEPTSRCADVIFAGCGNRVAVGTSARDVTKDGVRDMFGSVDEWVSDTSGAYRYQVRGGSLSEFSVPDAETWHGIRCARDL